MTFLRKDIPPWKLFSVKIENHNNNSESTRLSELLMDSTLTSKSKYFCCLLGIIISKNEFNEDVRRLPKILSKLNWKSAAESVLWKSAAGPGEGINGGFPTTNNVFFTLWDLNYDHNFEFVPISYPP